MRVELEESIRDFIRTHRVARMATADSEGHPSVVPICYAYDGEVIYSPIDQKPKAVAPDLLKRLQNIRVNPRVSLVIDDYAEDWNQLAYVLVSGVAEILDPADSQSEHWRAVTLLREKYVQYQKMAIDAALVIRITPTRIKGWAAAGRQDPEDCEESQAQN